MNRLMRMTIIEGSIEILGRKREDEITNIQMIQMNLRNTTDDISGRAGEKDWFIVLMLAAQMILSREIE